MPPLFALSIDTEAFAAPPPLCSTGEVVVSTEACIRAYSGGPCKEAGPSRRVLGGVHSEARTRPLKRSARQADITTQIQEDTRGRILLADDEETFRLSTTCSSAISR